MKSKAAVQIKAKDGCTLVFFKYNINLYEILFSLYRPQIMVIMVTPVIKMIK